LRNCQPHGDLSQVRDPILAYYGWRGVAALVRSVFLVATRKEGDPSESGGGKYPDDRLLSANGLCRDDLELFQSLRSSRVFRGDLYEYVSAAEVAIHRLVKLRLESKF